MSPLIIPLLHDLLFKHRLTQHFMEGYCQQIGLTWYLARDAWYKYIDWASKSVTNFPFNALLIKSVSFVLFHMNNNMNKFNLFI